MCLQNNQFLKKELFMVLVNAVRLGAPVELFLNHFVLLRKGARDGVVAVTTL